MKAIISVTEQHGLQDSSTTTLRKKRSSTQIYKTRETDSQGETVPQPRPRTANAQSLCVFILNQDTAGSVQRS